MSRPILGTNSEGRPVYIDVPSLIENRMLITATSGAGKSWTLRRILEQTHGHVQQIVIDPEDEFHTLREKFDYVLAGRAGGDCPADVKSAALLATKLLELRVSAIIGIYELPITERVLFVKLFLESLINAPKKLWHPCMVVIDEAHVFAPEEGNAESGAAVKDLMTRGRKRGFAGILASQRISQVSKEAAAPARNCMIGQATLDIDLKRASAALGFVGKDAHQRVQNLERGEFFVYGPALVKKGVELVTVGEVQTTHPRAGHQATEPPPPRDTIRKVLGELADLPAEADKKAKTEADLRIEIRDLKRQLALAPSTAPVAIKETDPQKITAAYERGAMAERKRLRADMSKHLKAALRETKESVDAIQAQREQLWESIQQRPGREAVVAIEQAISTLDKIIPVEAEEAPRNLGIRIPPGTTTSGFGAGAVPVIRRPDSAAVESNGKLTGPERKILDAVAWLESIGISSPNGPSVSFLAGYIHTGGGFKNPRGSLGTKGMIEYDGEVIRLTEEGRKHATTPNAALTSEELQRRVLERLPGPERKILKVIIDAYPKSLSNEEAAQRSEYEASGGGYKNPRSRLSSLGLISHNKGEVRAKDFLWID